MEFIGKLFANGVGYLILFAVVLFVFLATRSVYP
jgi:hypothetical protein